MTHASVSEFPDLLVIENDVTIPENTALSSSFNLIGTSLVGLVIPASWTTAVITLQVSYDNGSTFIDHYDETNTETTFTVDSSRVIGFGSNTIAKLVSVKFIKLRSGTTSSPEDQLGSDKIIKLLSRPL